MGLRNGPLYFTLTTICSTLVFGVHCRNGNSNQGSGFTEAELYCEAAAEQLANCCPDYDPGYISCDIESPETTTSEATSSCAGDNSSSTTTTMTPTLSTAESTCIMNEDCGSLVATGVCARARKAAGTGPTSKTTTVSGGCSPETTTTYEDAVVEAGETPEPPDTAPVCP